MWVNDVELTDIRNIHVVYSVHTAVQVHTEVFARDGLHLEGEFHLNVNMITLPGYRVVEKWRTPVERVYTVERETDADIQVEPRR
jgi:hypothetical protein